MHYQKSYDAAKARRYHFLLEELMRLYNTIPDIRSSRGRPVEFPLPTLLVLLGLKFDSGLGYRDFVVLLNFNPILLQRLHLDRAPSHALLNGTLKRLDTHHLHQMCESLARKAPAPQRVAVDSSGFSHSTGGEWLSVRFQKTQRRRFHALHNIVDPDTLMINASRVGVRLGGDAKHMLALVNRVPSRNLKVVYDYPSRVT